MYGMSQSNAGSRTWYGCSDRVQGIQGMGMWRGGEKCILLSGALACLLLPASCWLFYLPACVLSWNRQSRFIFFAWE